MLHTSIFRAKMTLFFSCDKEAFCQSNVGYNYILGIYKDDILLRNISQKEKVSKKSRPKNYDELLKFWVGKNLEESAKAFWRYNTKREWADIRNWKYAAKGWAKKAKDNLDVFKANKTKHTEPYSTDYESILPELTYNNWDVL